MNQISKKLQKLISSYNAYGACNTTGLLSPAKKQDINAAFLAMNTPPSKQLTEIWEIHGGQPYFDTGTDGLFGSYRLLSPAESIALYREMESNWSYFDPPPRYPPSEGDDGWWVPGLVPFGQWDQYVLLVDPVSEVVWGFCNAGLDCRFNDIGSLLDKILSCSPYSKPQNPTFESWAIEMIDQASNLYPKMQNKSQ